jgi:hypothetical protein
VRYDRSLETSPSFTDLLNIKFHTSPTRLIERIDCRVYLFFLDSVASIDCDVCCCFSSEARGVELFC